MVTKLAQTWDGGRSGRQRFTEKPHRGESLISILQSLEWLLEKQFSYVSMINPEHLHIFWIYAKLLGLGLSYFGLDSFTFQRCTFFWQGGSRKKNII
jgi:hypothetical protein